MHAGECALLEVIDLTEIKVNSGQLAVNGMPFVMNQRLTLNAGQVYLLAALGECSFTVTFHSESNAAGYCLSLVKSASCTVITRVLKDGIQNLTNCIRPVVFVQEPLYNVTQTLAQFVLRLGLVPVVVDLSEPFQVPTVYFVSTEASTELVIENQIAAASAEEAIDIGLRSVSQMTWADQGRFGLYD